jgi:TatD DNase family protein
VLCADAAVARRDLPALPPAPGPLFDSHAHLADARFAADLPQVLARAAGAGISEVLIPATEPADAGRAAAIARGLGTRIPRLYWSAGLHPHEAGRWEPDTAVEIAAALDAGAVAVGETGLDFHYDHASRTAQLAAFEGQAALARERELPLVVHSREADADTAALLRASGVAPERVILHCFSAGASLFREALERGYYVSFSGLITFAGYATPEVLVQVPEERVLVETDAPYLAPVPLRGRRNEPAFLPATLARLAAARGLDPQDAARLTRTNAFRVYKLGGLS